MPFIRALKNMGSRIARRGTTNGTGLRTIAPLGSLVPSPDPQRRGLLQRVFGWITNTIASINWSAVGVWIVNAISYAVNFNLNITTTEVNEEARQAWLRLGGSLGGLVGQGLGWLTCGALPGMVISTFAPNLGAYILSEVGEEAFQELSSTLSSLIREQAATWGGIAAKYTFIGLRNSLEFLLTGRVKKAEDRKPWSVARAWENFVENIDNEWVQNFVEELGEEFGDACLEAGYVVAYGFDQFASQVAANQAANQRSQSTVSVNF